MFNFLNKCRNHDGMLTSMLMTIGIFIICLIIKLVKPDIISWIGIILIPIMSLILERGIPFISKYKRGKK